MANKPNTCGECNGTGQLFVLGGDWGRTPENYRVCWRCDGSGKLCNCGAPLETNEEIEHGMCEGCAIDAYERHRAEREQRWLEDDRNWPEGAVPETARVDGEESR